MAPGKTLERLGAKEDCSRVAQIPARKIAFKDGQP
jgi:hypothetical protein